MDAPEFNQLYGELVVKPLETAGFARRGSSLFLESGDDVLALFRFGDKFSGLAQRTHLVSCVRHRFLRELTDMVVPAEPPATINDYPFKERPSRLSESFVSRWSYRPINLGVRSGDYDEIGFGEAKSVERIVEVLRPLAANMLSGGVKWLERLTPQEALRQLETNGENAWCERLWIADYKQRISKKGELSNREHS